MGHKSVKNKHHLLNNQVLTTYLPLKIDVNKKTVVFAVGECEHFYTDGKIWRLVKRVADQHPEWNVIGMTHDKELATLAKKFGIQMWVVNINSSAADEEQRLLATDALIQATNHITVPLSHNVPNLSLAKILALDDFAGSFSLLNADPADKICGTGDADIEGATRIDCLILPLIGVDNNTKACAGFYAWLAVQAYQHHISTVGLEISTLGNKYRFSQLPANSYAVKQLWSQEVLMREGKESVVRLPPEEAYLLRAGHQVYMDAYVEKEEEVRKLLQITKEEFVIVIPHHVTFIWDIRKVLEALVDWQDNVCIIIRADDGTLRRGMTEIQLAVRSYKAVLQKFKHSVVDGAVGIGLLLHLANVIIAPFASTITEQARVLEIPTIICQPGSPSGWESAWCKWEPIPSRVPEQLSIWRDYGAFNYVHIGDMLKRQLGE